VPQESLQQFIFPAAVWINYKSIPFRAAPRPEHDEPRDAVTVGLFDETFGLFPVDAFKDLFVVVAGNIDDPSDLF